MKNDNYIYSTAEMAKYYGLTRKGLAFYEDKGIISPTRTDNNKYRIFSLQDCYNLYHTKLFANCECSLAETADLLQCSDLSQLIASIDGKCEQMRRELQIKERILYHAGRLTSTLKRAEKGPFYEIVSSPDFYRLFVRRYYDEHVFTKEASIEYERWNHLIPIDTASLKYSLMELESEGRELNTDIGNIMLAHDFHLLDFKVSERVEHLAPVKSLHTILISNDVEISNRAYLKAALSYLDDHHYTLAGDPFTSLLAVIEAKDGMPGRTRYDEAWFPIEDVRAD